MPFDTELCSPSLTGVWQGRFSYEDGRSCGFVATLMELSCGVSGTTHEINELGIGAAKEFFAFIDGQRAGRTVTFTKTYDGTGGRLHSVAYSGHMTGDGTEIEGQWEIPTLASGTFLMLRSGGRTQAAAKPLYAEA